MIRERDRPDLHKGIELPEGMSPGAADKLERMIAEYVDDPSMYPLEFGVRIFREISGNRPSRRGR